MTVNHFYTSHLKGNLEINQAISSKFSPFLKNILKNSEDTLEISHNLLHNPFEKISDYSTATRNILNLLIKFSRCRSIFFSQDYIANRLGICREWVNKCIKLLCQEGLISKIYRHRDTCIYKLGAIFRNIDWTWKLRGVLTSLSLHIYMLRFPFPVAKFTPKERLLFNISLTTIESISFEAEASRKMFRCYEKFLKREEAMQETIDLLGLTQNGVARVMAYPSDAIVVTTQMLKKRGFKDLRDPVSWFFTMMAKYCKEYGLSPNWQIMREQIRDLNIDPESPLVDAKIRKVATTGRSPINSPVYSKSSAAPLPRSTEFDFDCYEKQKEVLKSTRRRDFTPQTESRAAKANEFLAILNAEMPNFNDNERNGDLPTQSTDTSKKIDYNQISSLLKKVMPTQLEGESS